MVNINREDSKLSEKLDEFTDSENYVTFECLYFIHNNDGINISDDKIFNVVVKPIMSIWWEMIDQR